jgi:hypothetical protein
VNYVSSHKLVIGTQIGSTHSIIERCCRENGVDISSFDNVHVLDLTILRRADVTIRSNSNSYADIYEAIVAKQSIAGSNITPATSDFDKLQYLFLYYTSVVLEKITTLLMSINENVEVAQNWNFDLVADFAYKQADTLGTKEPEEEELDEDDSSTKYFLEEIDEDVQ